MTHEESEIIRQFAILIVALGGGGAAVNAIDWLKATFNLSGYAALATTAAVATVLAVAALIVEGQLSPDGVNWQNFGQVVAIVLWAAKARFDMLRAKEKKR
ncbi:MAG: hypothetical protein L0332_06785 [Chloroflexi bacterium]|nr:hypothetical protein [Chloroflexota bacterium]